MNGNGVVLIVDDHAPLARSLVSLFSASGFDAQAVHSGAEALAFVRTHAAVALILLDMSMPDMSGVEVLRAMRVPGGGHSRFAARRDVLGGRRSGDSRRGSSNSALPASSPRPTRAGCCASSRHMSARPTPRARRRSSTNRVLFFAGMATLPVGGPHG